MLFYCPNCRKEVEAAETGTVITKSGRVAHKASCPTCGQDMAEFTPGEKVDPPADTSAAPSAAGVPQPSVETAAGVPQPSMEVAAATAPVATPAMPVAPAETETKPTA